MRVIRLIRKITAVVSLLLVGILILGTIICNENAALINSTLNIRAYKVVEKGEGDEDTLYFKSAFNQVGDVKNNALEKAEQIVAEGTVLLKNNNNALPLSKTDNISLFGVGAYDSVYGGTGSGGISGAELINYAKSLKDDGFTINPTLESSYNSTEWRQYRRKRTGNYGNTSIQINEAPWSVVNDAAGDTFSEYGDAAIYVISRIGGEGYDLIGIADDGIDNGDGLGKDYLGLNENELSVIEGLKQLKEDGIIDKIIIVINYSSMIEGDFLKDPAIDAAIWAGAPGAGNAAFAKILSGEVNPSGRLPDTMWMDNAKNPVNVNFGWWVYENAEELDVSVQVGNLLYPEVTLASYEVYQEGVYLGYKYTETRYEDVVLGTPNVGTFNYNEVVAYPFGHGLSYSNFQTSDITVSKTGTREYTVSVKVTNDSSSNYSGKYSVPIYISKPYGEYAKSNGIQVPAVELISYEKTKILAPGESETLTIKLDEKFFTSYDANEAKGYVLMDGDYYIAVGGSAHEAVNNVLAAKKANGISVNTDQMVGGTGDASKVKKISLDYNKSKYQLSDVRSSIDDQYHIVTNLFDFCDINRYSGRGNNSVKYYDRSKWNEVSFDMVNGHPKLRMTEQMAREVYAQVPEGTGNYNNVPPVPDKYKQPIPKDNREYPTYGKDAGLKLVDLMYDSNGDPISFFDPIWDEFLDQLSWEDTVTLVGDGYHRTMAIQSIAKPSTKDENGPNGITRARFNSTAYPNSYYYLTEKEKGNVTEDGSFTSDADPDGNQRATGFPSNGLLAATFNPQLAKEVGEALGEEALWAGWSGLYGTGLNIHRSPYSGRTNEYFSEDGMLSGLQGAYFAMGVESKGMHVYNKHFALNDQEACRHGIAVWAPEQAIREIYLRAFELPITMGGAFNVMASFNRLGTWAAPACKELITGFLRHECGMKGVVLTDFYGDMDGSQNIDPYYEQVYAQYIGTCDIPDGPQPLNQGHFDKFETDYGEMAWQMRLSAKRICYHTLWSNAMNGISSTTEIVPITPWWFTLLVSLTIVFGVLLVGSVGWTIVDYIFEIKKKKSST